MDISLHADFVNFRTPFSEKWDLIQIFSGAAGEALRRNGPLDFHAAGLQRAGHGDIWHLDTVLAYCTDETTPVLINGDDMGGNHGYSCAVEVYLPGHGKTTEDVGSLWEDEDGIRFTLLRVTDGDRLLLLSDNQGPSMADFRFASAARGTLSHVSGALHPESIVPLSQRGKCQLTPAVRFTKREMYYLKDGVRHPITGYHTGCDSACLVEEYEVVHPATVGDALRQGRPAGGYAVEPHLGVGEAIFRYRMVYRVAGDGTVICDFDHEALGEVCFHGYLGVMYQEKCDAFGGGIRRYIPGLLPFEDGGVRYDFSYPVNTSEGPFPSWHRAVREEWADRDLPPSRQVDLLCASDGSVVISFGGGFLPLYDGHPSIRRNNVANATTIVSSRKSYPTFCGDDPFTGVESTRGMKGARGVGFKKYFLPEGDGGSVFSVEHDGVTYLYGDFWKGEALESKRAIPEGASVTVLEKTGDADFAMEAGEVILRGSRGTVVLAVSG